MTDAIKAAVLTSGRQDYGILRSTMKLLSSDHKFELLLLVGGMHLSTRYGRNIKIIEEDGFIITKAFDWLENNGRDLSIHEQTGSIIHMIGDELNRLKPDFLILVGDRYETIAAALAAVLSCIPIVHLHGGEETEGSFDNQFRHAITKMSHLHLVSHSSHAARIIQMGEAPGTVHIVGAPGLDNLFRDDLPSRLDLEIRLGIRLDPPVVLATIHPVTLNSSETSLVISSLIFAMTKVEATYVITLPNADPGNLEITKALRSWGKDRSRVFILESLGDKDYFGMMRLADSMIGNSSSGLIEAGVYQLPVVDIGSRQKGRLRGPNVIHANPEKIAVRDSLNLALSNEFHFRISQTTSPYGDGKSGQRIIDVLKSWALPKTTLKVFHHKDNTLDSQ